MIQEVCISRRVRVAVPKLGAVTSLNRSVADKTRRAEMEVMTATRSAGRRQWKRKSSREDTRRQSSVTEDIQQLTAVNSHPPQPTVGSQKEASPHARGSPGGLA